MTRSRSPQLSLFDKRERVAALRSALVRQRAILAKVDPSSPRIRVSLPRPNKILTVRKEWREAAE